METISGVTVYSSKDFKHEIKINTICLHCESKRVKLLDWTLIIANGESPTLRLYVHCPVHGGQIINCAI
jgi:hypothetical protein